MKQLILIIMCILLSNCSFFRKKAVESAIGICRLNENNIRISYLDSTHDITKVDSLIRGDTLILNIYVSYVTKHEGYSLIIDKNIKYINYGEKTVLYESLPICSDEKSGKAALEHIKELQKE